MGLTDWIISISSGTIVIIMSVAAYFAQKWIQSVDETLKKHSEIISKLSKQVVSFEQKQNNQTENISRAVQFQISTIKLPHAKMEEIGREIVFIKSVIQERVLPVLEAHSIHFGRVMVLDDQIKDQNIKLMTMFNTLKLLVQKPKDQK